MEPAKIESFSDGVFSVSMTLLIFHVQLPEFSKEKTNSELLFDLSRLWPYYISLFISFFTILIMWINHHGIFKIINKIDGHFMFANGLLLFLVTIVPFPTLIVSQFLLTPSAKGSCAIYAGVFLLINICYNWVWFAASHKRKLLISSVTDEHIRKVKINYMIGFPMYLAALIIAFINPYVSLGICMLLWVFWIFTLKFTNKNVS
jgi:uncharacterized membrane protein